jgi:hypothetical protein
MSIATKKQLKLGKSTVRELTGDEGSVVGGGAAITPKPPITPTLTRVLCQSAVDRCPTRLACPPGPITTTVAATR